MGAELAPPGEWDHDHSLPWHRAPAAPRLPPLPHGPAPALPTTPASGAVTAGTTAASRGSTARTRRTPCSLAAARSAGRADGGAEPHARAAPTTAPGAHARGSASSQRRRTLRRQRLHDVADRDGRGRALPRPPAVAGAGTSAANAASSTAGCDAAVTPASTGTLRSGAGRASPRTAHGHAPADADVVEQLVGAVEQRAEQRPLHDGPGSRRRTTGVDRGELRPAPRAAPSTSSWPRRPRAAARRSQRRSRRRDVHEVVAREAPAPRRPWSAPPPGRSRAPAAAAPGRAAGASEPADTRPLPNHAAAKCGGACGRRARRPAH